MAQGTGAYVIIGDFTDVPIDGGGGGGSSSEVTIDFGATTVENGLSHPLGGDGDTISATIGGRDCHRNMDPSFNDYYFYFAASAPNPANAATGVATNAQLSWTAGSGATSHDVRFGTANPPPFVINQAATSYNPGTLANNTTYFWRIDEKNGAGTTCTGTCTAAVLEGNCADKLAVYYSTAGVNGPWTLLEAVNASTVTQNVWATRTLNLPVAANNQANFTLRFRWQFNRTQDKGRLDNIKVIDPP